MPPPPLRSPAAHAACPPPHTPPLQAKGNAAFSAGNFPEAVEHFTASIALDPANHVLYSNRSAAQASMNAYDAALADAQRTTELKPEWPKGYSRLGAAHFGLRQWEEACAAYTKGGWFAGGDRVRAPGRAVGCCSEDGCAAFPSRLRSVFPALPSAPPLTRLLPASPLPHLQACRWTQPTSS